MEKQDVTKQTVQVPVLLIEQIANYLGTKPFIEVTGLIGEIMKLRSQLQQPTVVKTEEKPIEK